MCDRARHRAWHKVVRLHRAAFSSTDTIPMLQPDVIRKALAHRGLADEPPRPPPPGSGNSSTAIGDDNLSVSAGRWIMLAPLSAGEHTIHFTVDADDAFFGPFALDVTYNLTVE